MNITHIADASDAIAFRAFYTFVTPALRTVARHRLQSVFHPGHGCGDVHSGQPPHLCADCAEVIDDLTLEAFTRMRRAIAAEIGDVTAGGQIRELALVAAHARSPEAAEEDTATMAVRLTRLDLTDPDAGPAWLRAAKAQLIYYPTRHLTAQLRRDQAVARHGAAKPDRDLNTAMWAAPLRSSKAGLELLIAFIYRLRLGVGDPYRTPTDIRDRHQLTTTAANALLRTTLRRLQALRPDFFDANIHTPLAIAAQISLDTARPVAEPDPSHTPENMLLAQEAADHARAVLRRLISQRPGEDTAWRQRRQAYRQVLTAVAAATDFDGRDLLTSCALRLGLTDVPASRMLRRLARLAADADADWVTDAVADTALSSYAEPGRAPAAGI